MVEPIVKNIVNGDMINQLTLQKLYNNKHPHLIQT